MRRRVSRLKSIAETRRAIEAFSYPFDSNRIGSSIGIGSPAAANSE